MGKCQQFFILYIQGGMHFIEGAGCSSKDINKQVTLVKVGLNQASEITKQTIIIPCRGTLILKLFCLPQNLVCYKGGKACFPTQMKCVHICHINMSPPILSTKENRTASSMIKTGPHAKTIRI